MNSDQKPSPTVNLAPELLAEAVRCDLWPDDMHDIVDAVNAASDAGDFSTEQCIALGVLLERRRALASLSASVGVTATHQHVKRGTEYVLIGIGKMQAERWHTNARLDDSDGGFGFVVSDPVDMCEVAIYRSATDPAEIWVRPREEFEDGRFVALEPLSLPSSGGTEPIPRLENCGRYMAQDNKDRWYYLNHANTWQSYQGPSSGGEVVGE